MELTTNTEAPATTSPTLYRIAWVNKTETCRHGKGTKAFLLSEAEALCKELNVEYPHIQHTVEPVL